MSQEFFYRAHNIDRLPGRQGLFPNPFLTVDRRPLNTDLALHYILACGSIKDLVLTIDQATLWQQVR